MLPHLLEHQCLCLYLTSLLCLEMSLSGCMSLLLLDEGMLLLCQCLQDLS